MCELIYRLQRRQKETFVEVVIGHQPPDSWGAALRLIGSSERELFRVLIGDEADVGPIRLPPSRMHMLLLSLSRTGRLFFKTQKILLDPFSSPELFLEAAKRDDGFYVSGFVRQGEHVYPLQEYQEIFYGCPPVVLRGPILQFLKEDIDQDLLFSIYPAPWKLSEEHFRKFVDDKGRDPPELRWPDSLDVVAMREQPVWPILQLCDRRGMFANLWMDYPGRGRVEMYGDCISPWRRPCEEVAWEKDLLETGFCRRIESTSQYFCPLDEVLHSLTFLLEIGWTVLDYRKKQIHRQETATLELRDERDRLLLCGTVRYGQHSAHVHTVLGALNRRELFLDLSDGAVGLLDPQHLHHELLEGAECTEIEVSLPKHKVGAYLSWIEQEEIACADGVKQFLAEIQGNEGVRTEYLPSAMFAGTLYPYQQAGVNWLSALYGHGLSALLADEMGLGKTVQVLAFLSRILPQAKHPTLLVVPTSLLFHWQREIVRFLPSVHVYQHHGVARLQKPENITQHSLILTSYALLRIDAALFRQINYTLIVLDEAQAIKNPDSQIAEVVFGLQGHFRLAITGTPVENRLTEIWSLFRFLQPGLLGMREQFDAEIVAGEEDGRHVKRVRKWIQPFVLRRKKEVVGAQMPKKIEQTIWVEMDTAQLSVYQQMLAVHKGKILRRVHEEGVAGKQIEILEAILRLRQVCCHPALADPAFVNVPSAKLERLLADLEELQQQGAKALIYSQFTEMLRRIEQEVCARGWRYTYLDGQTKDREAVVQQFQTDPSISFFLISLKAGGVGLNLQAAEYVLLYDPWWNDAVEQQAIDRAHRIGRTDHVIARRYVTTSTIEEKLLLLKERKKQLAQQMFADLPGEISAEDWLALL